MTYFFSPAGRQALKALSLQRILYASDFDGTIAPIDADRQRVQIQSRIHALIHELSKLAPGAVVSGRSLQDLTPRVNGPSSVRSPLLTN
jgi:trehalose 6-phosphate phosphatase